ncbi:MAG: hypothetical protein KAG96_05760 [Ichthyobacteriaceae bacterium]|nr:hypothetical protein [Ichthyobacteriaceae bacterium]
MKKFFNSKMFFFFGILIVGAISSCNKGDEKLNIDESVLDDASLIMAIKDYNAKKEVAFVDLPSNSKDVIKNDYAYDYAGKILVAYKLGYEVLLRREKGVRVGVQQKTYFDVNGRELKVTSNALANEGANKGVNGGIDVAEDLSEGRPEAGYAVDGWEVKNPMEEVNRRECFELVYPVEFTLSGVRIIIENEQGWATIKSWYLMNPDSNEQPKMKYPVSVTFEGNDSVTIKNANELEALEIKCYDDGDDDVYNDNDKGVMNSCFVILYPVNYVMSDNSIITISSNKDWQLIKEWYILNDNYVELPDGDKCPENVIEGGDVTNEIIIYNDYGNGKDTDVVVEPGNVGGGIVTDIGYSLQFPVKVLFYDGDIIVVNNRNELIELEEKCVSIYEPLPIDLNYECYVFQYPVNYILADNKVVTVNSKEEYNDLFYTDLIEPNTDSATDEMPTSLVNPILQYPVKVSFENGEVITVNNNEDMEEVELMCTEDFKTNMPTID